MKRVLPTSLLLSLAVVGSSLAAQPIQAASPTARICTSQGRTNLASDYVRLVRGVPAGDARWGFYACRRGARQAVHLFDQDFAPLQTQLAGRFVVDETISCERREPYACKGQMLLYDARTQRFRRSTIVPAATGHIRTALSLLVTSGGSAAWVRDSHEAPGSDVWVWSPGAAPRMVASSPGIDPRSLAATSHTLYWTDNDLARSLPLA